MAYAITDKPNTSAPDSDYPYGNIRDKEIGTPGTGVNKLVYADFHQFFAKLMNYAGVTPNGLPDNEYSGWQLMESLIKLMGGVKTKIIEIGAWDMDASATPGTILHGIASINNIRSVDALIIRDDNQARYQFSPGADSCYVTGTQVILTRTTSGFFDTTNFDDAAMNRGYVIIKYTEDL